MSGPHDGQQAACPRPPQLPVGSPANALSRPGSLPEERHFDALPTFHDTAEYAALVKTQSTSNLLRARGPPAIETAKRMSFDAGQLDRMAR
jgi:protein-serine/threonine kinase